MPARAAQRKPPRIGTRHADAPPESRDGRASVSRMENPALRVQRQHGAGGDPAGFDWLLRDGLLLDGLVPDGPGFDWLARIASSRRFVFGVPDAEQR
jgi:hypothetical protein